MEQNKGQITHIEALRAIAALMVLLFHFITFYNGETFLIANETVRRTSEFGAQGVEMFYIISGFVMMLSLSRKKYSIANFGAYCLKRGLRILPVYWLVIAMMILIDLAWQVTPNWNNILANMSFSVELFEGTGWMNPVFSTLGVEVQFYLLLGLLFPLLKANRWLKYVVFAIWLLAGYFTPDQYTVLNAGPFFIVGILLYDASQSDRLLNFGGIALVLFGLGVLQQFQDLAIVGITLLLMTVIQPTWKPLVRLGEVSYSIYLTHGIFGGWLLYFCASPFYANLQSPWLILPGVAFSILGAFAVFWVIEKRSMAWSKSVRMPSGNKKSQ